MPAMSRIEQGFCASGAWSALTCKVVLPWAMQGQSLSGDVLEIGGGSGAMAEGILRRFDDVCITCTDPDPEMVRVASDRLAPYEGRASVSRADATALDCPDASFDAVVSFLMLHHIVDWEDALDEVVRVLRPGGVVIGYDLLDNAVSRAIHVVDRSPIRLASLAELEAKMIGLGVACTFRPLLGSLLRFRLVVAA